MGQHCDSDTFGERLGLPPSRPRRHEQADGEDGKDDPQDDCPRAARGRGSDRRDPPPLGNPFNDESRVSHARHRIGAFGMREAVMVQPTFLTPARLMALSTSENCPAKPPASIRTWTLSSG